MSWSWRYELPADATDPGAGAESFSTQSDAESWIGENYRDLLEAGVHSVTLLEDDRPSYTMSLDPA